MNVIHVRTVQIDGLRINGFDAFFLQFFSAADAFQVTAFTAPDWNRSSPISGSGNCPVLDFCQPVAETLLADKRRVPVHGVVVLYQLILQLAHLDIPARLCIVYQRSAASPAVRIVVDHLLLGVYLILPCQILENLNIQAIFHYEAAGPWSLGKSTLLVYRSCKRNVVAATCVVVVFTKCISGMNQTGTILGADIIRTCNEERLLVSVFHLYERHELLIFLILQILTLHGFQNFILAFSQHLVCQSLSDNQHVAFFRSFQHLCTDVIHFRTNGNQHVGRQGPRCGGPCQEVLVVHALALELASYGQYGNLLVSLCNLVGSQTRSAASAVRLYLVTFVNQSGIEELLQNPPAGFNIIVLVCNIRIIQVRHVCHAVGHIRPHAGVLEYGLTALLVEFLNAVLLDVLLSVHSQLLLNLNLNRQSVGIPSGLSLNLESLHRLVPINGVLQSSRHNVVNTRLAVCCRWSFEKDEAWAIFSFLYAAVQKVNVFPMINLFLLGFCDGFF